MEGFPESWTVTESGRWDSIDGRFSISRVGTDDWRLTEIVYVGRRSAGRLFAVLEYDRRFTSPRQAVCYAIRLARWLRRSDRSDRLIGRGRPPKPA